MCVCVRVLVCVVCAVRGCGGGRGGRRVQAHGGWILKAEGRYWWYGEDKEGPTYHNGK